MASLVYLSLLLCLLLDTNNGSRHTNPFRYKGWGWTPQWHGLTPAIPSLRKITKECVVTLSNATFNLFPLHLNELGQLQSYKVKDLRSLDDPNDDYLYEFNVCGPVGSLPAGCEETTIMKNTYDNNPRMYCEDNDITINETTGEASCNVEMKSVGNSTVYAYQMKLSAPDENGKQTVTDCYHLSDTEGGPGTWGLINEDNPSEGVVVTYHDGDYSPFCQHNREINISFVCDNDHDTYGIPGLSSSEVDYSRKGIDDDSLSGVTEPELCQYKLEFHTIYGCPSQCPIVRHKMCNGVGLCGYDWVIKQPRCYCYSWWTGDSCTEFDIAQVFKPKHDPIDANLSKPYVKRFNHTLKDATKKNHTVTVVYDLEEFKAEKSKPYVMRDVDGYGAFARYYVWNFFEDIDMDADVINVTTTNKTTLNDFGCKHHTGYCKSGVNDCGDNDNLVAGPGYVYQIDTFTETCIMAGGKTIDWQLYDSDNPAKGVTLDFKNGDYCAKIGDVQTNRHFKITLQCPDDNNAYVKLSDEQNRIFDAFVTEDNFQDIGAYGNTDFCGYHVTLKSAFACPDECLSDVKETKREDDVSVCSTQGMCASDPFSGYVHCLCDKGWTGDKCDVVYVAPPLGYRTKNMGSYIAAIVIISVILVGICWFGYKKIAAQKQKVKELEIKLVNYQSSGGAQTFNDDDRPPQIDDMPQSKGPSLSDKIKNKLGRNKRGKYANISSQNDDDDDEQELFNVKVKMNGGHSDDDEEENDDDAEYNKPNQYQIGGDDEDESESDSNENEDDK